MTDVLSFGGGVNSSALAILLVNEGWRGHIVFADTGAEHPDTYCWLDYFEREWLQPRELSITRLGAEWRAPRYDVDLIGFCERRLTLPQLMRRWCTVDYKAVPMDKWSKAHGCDPDLRIIGIDAGESWRMMSARRPLVDRGIDRDGCVRIIEAEGLPVPPKSGCVLCPFQRDSQWRDLWRRYPEVFERLAQLEDDCSRRRGTRRLLDKNNVITLRQRQLRYESQLTLLDDAEMDELLEYRPCMCSL